MKRIFECNDELSLAGDISFGPQLLAYMSTDKSKKMQLKSQLSLGTDKPPLPGQRAQTAGASFNSRKKTTKGASNDAFQLRQMMPIQAIEERFN